MNKQDQSMATLLATVTAQQEQINVIIDVLKGMGQESKTVNRTGVKTVCLTLTKAGEACKMRPISGTDMCMAHTRQAMAQAGESKPAPRKTRKTRKSTQKSVAQASVIDGRAPKQVRDALKAGEAFTWHSATAKAFRANLRKHGSLTYVSHEGRVGEWALDSKFGKFTVKSERRNSDKTPVRSVTPVS